MSGLNALDYILLLVLVGFLISGYLKGFVWQAMAIVGVIASFVVASRYHLQLAEMSFLDSLRARSDTLALVVSFAAIFLLGSLVTGFIASKIGRKLKDKGLKAFDKNLGAVLGIAKGVILLGGVALLIGQWGLPEGGLVSDSMRQKGQGYIAESTLLPYLTDGCLVMIDMIPSEAREEIAKQYSETIEKVQVAGAEGREATTTTGAGEAPATSANPAAGTVVKPDGLLPGTRSLVAGDSSKPSSPTDADVTTPAVPAVGEAAKPSVATPSVTASTDADAAREEMRRRLPLLGLGTLRRLHREVEEAKPVPATSSESGTPTPATAKDE